MQQVVLASSNLGKIREIEPLLSNLPLQIIPQSHFNLTDAVEDAATFVENALIKARHACQHTRLPAIADDSGLAVAALNGAPGIITARYAGAARSDKANIDKVLAKLADKTERQAEFHSVMIYMEHAEDPCPIICHGRWSGNILYQRQGTGGFGYDPIFWVPTHQCSAAELPAEVKQKISHRGHALTNLVNVLKKKYSNN
ncbi:non-canonical purine NTP pyrophosphatase [Piscirickettsia salmonis]|uniref:dITP/XTP pyrophosphatase n=1 Tax=Piscirickettsia salmonis TaxID=1238 RepID=A0A9Q6PUM7_PISSA|nr:RdgB/HAM1 family non-canonical purine NTP pyrophosphatase [Piscirickettsia salmonis]ALA26463.1 nucleoside-triphosphate diphosphatase [Piscirickettsia salmonis]APS43884.1 non-canonical purine NTP pyrophosphatase [Piscirickettsia salmonis]APS47238.1 non-canonical purine NTP pyrophosphatase [Piscirickettsia salmonis]APS51324.1 non-canonical purine NTP pyrophosphatase [Piscirickettsia salmonis]APS54532.1 non-canonical purine NTP pyrophosphatase [Piscirickettsia salmonis]